MGDKTVKFSDLSSELILDDGQLASLTVLKHPAISSPVTIEALATELKAVERHRLDVVIFDLHLSGEEPQRIVMQVTAFDALAKDHEMADVLSNATRAKPVKTKAASNGEHVDYSDPSNAGIIHRGKITDDEARFVRNNIDQANANRKRVEQSAIDVNDPKERQRYGLKDADSLLEIGA
jgi:hypothetical protein